DVRHGARPRGFGVNIERIGIVGAGQMGTGIAQVAAQAGFRVLLHDNSAAALANSMATLDKALERLEVRDKIAAEDRRAALARVQFVHQAEALEASDLVLEAASEVEATKIELFQR